MHSSAVFTGVLLMSGALLLSGCGSSAVGSGSVTSSSPSGVSVASGAAGDPLANLTRADLESVLLTPAQIAGSTPKMVRETPTSLGTSTLVGAGGTCPALATLLRSGALFESGGPKADTVQVSYNNFASVGGMQRKVRSVSQIVHMAPDADLAPILGRYRAAVAGCSTPLVNVDGSRIRMSVLPDPTGLGTHSLALASTHINPPVALGAPFENVMEFAASGPNAMFISTSGYTTEERSTITAQAWKNVTSRH